MAEGVGHGLKKAFKFAFIFVVLQVAAGYGTGTMCFG